MGIREKLNENPAITTAVTAGIILLTLVFMLYQFGLFSGSTGPQTDGEIYFTDDGGNTFVPGDADEIFSRGPDGQPRVRAHVYQYPGEDPQIAYMSRYTPEAIELVEQVRANPDDEQLQMQLGTLEYGSREVARPGSDEWHNTTTETGIQIANPPGPNAEGERATEVLP